MSSVCVRVVIVAALSLIGLAGCETSITEASRRAATKTAYTAEPESTGSIKGATGPVAAETLAAKLATSDPQADVGVGKTHLQAKNFELAEKYFRRAAEWSPND